MPLGGAFGWAVYLLCTPLQSELLQYFLGTLALSTYAEVMARAHKAPATRLPAGSLAANGARRRNLLYNGVRNNRQHGNVSRNRHAYPRYSRCAGDGSAFGFLLHADVECIPGQGEVRPAAALRPCA